MAFGKVDLVEGAVLSVNKPLGWSSFQLLSKFRYSACRFLGIKKLKVGHAGTLDPLATGVVVLCTGKKTKLIESIQSTTKEYIADIRFGATTPSFDMETEIDKEYDYKHITEKMLLDSLVSFVGEKEQIPPVFSAVKVNGTRSYSLARSGQTVDLKPKKVTIYDIELLENNMPDVKIRISCGKGTYIRSIARDLGISLNSGAYLTGLVRTKVDEHTIANSINIEDIDNWLSDNVIGLEINNIKL